MKWVLLGLLSLSILVCNAQSICVSVDCKDTIRYPAPVTLNGLTQSADGVKSRLWKVTSGSATITNPNVDTTVATNMIMDGLYVFSLTGTSNKGAVATAFDSVIYTSNKPPQAITGPTINDTINTAVLSGSASFDPEGLPLTFLWTQVSGPSVASINAPTMSNPLISGLINGSYSFRLTVTDQGGLSNTAIQNVIVAIPVKLIKTVTVVTQYWSDGTTTVTTSTVP